MEIKEGDIYICKVKKLLQHGVIVYIAGEKEGFIHISELSKRWVRDVKDIAKEGDMLVCKVITTGPSPELSIKRVTDSEKREALREWSIENRLINLIEKLYKKDTEKLKAEILKKYGSVYKFYESIIKNGEEELSEMKIKKEAAKELLDFVEKTKKKVIIKNQIELKTYESDGIGKIKEVLTEFSKIKGVSIKYIKSPVYIMTIDMGETKKTLNENKKIIEQISKKSKSMNVDFKCTEIRQ
ncbi:MAG: translation initiation factor 2, alpha subunit [Candidatus Parvarchaeum acidophilus ARMAN-5]|jgi:translation initiation factor 2 alpha subunit (eIF-2alpha)|uniref:Translation initiation factor 2, alpha subunit n=1 Tax=Candidatus Parvarchaeum acidophilus ARMAN-5 TaxID=662762 RepID=D6GWX2_PARA5|nr:MAG: translation initiation factor 2, alpha subunit [Candidatus Parvarchaeum acidophilus ARMAN-5]